MRSFVAEMVFLCAATSLPAQWLKYKTPGIPRSPDGKPDLNAPAPKLADGKPDLSGIWQGRAGGYSVNIASDLKPGDVLPWAEALYQQRTENLSTDHPGFHCLPDLGFMISFGMFKIVQSPGTVAFLAEDTYRQVLTDGRPLPQDPNPTWKGYSVGRWDGDTLVVESAGFNDRTWLDFGGHPHTEALHVTERYRRKDFGHMTLSITLEDPKAYTRPWIIALDVDLAPDTELLEYVCNENERDLQHFVVTDEDRKNSHGVKVATGALAKYTGIYEFVDDKDRPIGRDGKPQGPSDEPLLMTVAVSGDQLTLQLPGAGGKLPLVPQADGEFSVVGQLLDFLADERGAVNAFVLHIVEEDRKAIRKGDAPKQ